MTAMEKNEAREQAQKPKPSARMLSLLGPLVTAASLPILYLNGKAYHDAYLGYFKLEPSMFPQDTASTLISAVIGWFHAMLAGLKGVLGLLEQHYGLVLGMALVIVLIMAPMSVMLTRLGKRLDSRRSASRQNRLLSEYVKEAGLYLFWLFTVSYSVFALMFMIALLLSLSISPFYAIGKKVAAEDLKAGFVNAPRVELSDPKGRSGDFRIIECSSMFCALYASGRAVVVPVSAIDWAESDLSDRQ
ncbi:hypothetical protein NOX82_18775 [Pseudomonas citronellolis]|uniref:hypothetical protein n=1 Tax=Pseudomonas citronellolis TaxID=53408 RepID=UPI002110FD5E|nr:hypothetical protein [Pseudomonas citronellolis]UUC47946.1 hypothetical protein NOX82_18775 [Pseudomonas citronellolis]